MWHLEARGARGTPFHDLGSFASISDAVRRINEYEGKPEYESVFLRVYVDPTGGLPLADTDAAILSCLEYQTARHYYALTRESN